MSYDPAGNLDWSAEGRVSANDCATARTNVPAINKIQRVYEKETGLIQLIIQKRLAYPAHMHKTPILPTANSRHSSAAHRPGPTPTTPCEK